MIPSKPPIVRPTRALPFDQLPWDDFERLCLMLLPREGFESHQHYGAAGGEQGRDIVAHRDGNLWYVQCKRVKRCGPKVLLDEIDRVQELMGGDPDLRPAGMLFIVSCDVSATARDRASKRCKELGLACEVWGRTDLDARVQPHPDIVRTFFGFERYARPITVPFQVPPLPAHFVPRPEVTDALKAQLSKHPAFVTLVGMGGLGKTCLALAAVQDLEDEGHFVDGVFWLDGRCHANLGALVMTLGGLLHLDLSQRTLTEQRQAVTYMLRGRTALVVLDNFESIADPLTVLDFLRGLACSVLAISRVRLPEFKEPFTATPLTSDTALELFAAVSGDASLIHHPDTDALCNQDLEGHPLAIEVMAALAATGLTPTELRQYLRESPLVVLDVDSDLLETKSVVQALDISYQRLTPMAQTSLTRASVFLVDFDLAGLATLTPDQSRLALANAIRELEARSLLQSVGPALYRLHAVTRQYAYGLLEDRPVYHRRTAQYFLTEREDSLAAVGQFLRAGDEQAAATLVPEHVENWIHAGRASESLAILNDFDTDKVDPVAQVSVYEARGDLQYLLGELDEAVHQYEEAIESSVWTDAITRVRLHRKLADVFSRRGEYDDALACLMRGRDLLTDVGDTTDAGARLAVGYGAVLLALGRHDDAIAEARTALDRLSEASADPRIAADLRDLIGKVHFFKGDFAESLNQFQSALELRRGCSDQQGVIKSYSNLAVVYGEEKRYAEALQANETALKVAEQISDTVALAVLYVNMAADYTHQGSYEQATDFNNHSLALCAKMGDIYGLAVAHHNLGEVYRRTERFDLATEHLTQAIELADQVGDKNGIVCGMGELAEVYLAQGRVEEALVHCQESLHLAERIDDQLWQPQNLSLLGRLHHVMGQWEEARADFVEACQIWREREAWLDLSGTLLNWAKLERDAGQMKRARELCAQAATLAGKCEADDLIQQASALLLELASTAESEKED